MTKRGAGTGQVSAFEPLSRSIPQFVITGSQVRVLFAARTIDEPSEPAGGLREPGIRELPIFRIAQIRENVEGRGPAGG
jgi:hypothetical protein